MKSSGPEEAPGADPGQPASPAAPHDPYAALRFRDYRLYLTGTVLAASGHSMLNMVVCWEIYERTQSKLDLGYVGLAQIVPVLLFSLPSGLAADRFERRKIIMAAQGLKALAALGLAAVSWTTGPVWAIYACLFASGVSRSFQGPARSALLPHLVPRQVFGNAVTWSSSGIQVAFVSGPALGGLALAQGLSAGSVYALDAAAALTFAALIWALPRRPAARPNDGMNFQSLATGIEFVWRTEVLLAAMTLDLIAVLLGGATALLPVYAKDILHVGPAYLGLLRAAPAVGAVAMALMLTHRPPFRRAGPALFCAVSGYGVATIVFGYSTSFELSMAMLALGGALDAVSMVIRHTLLQLRTPDEMRGRVAAVNTVFISSSNELGELESGVVAEYFGPVFSVVSGGAGTLLAVLAVGSLSPQLRRLNLRQSGELPAAAGAAKAPVAGG